MEKIELLLLLTSTITQLLTLIVIIKDQKYLKHPVHYQVLDNKIVPINKEILNLASGPAKFFEPISDQERFDNAKNIDDLLQ